VLYKFQTNTKSGLIRCYLRTGLVDLEHYPVSYSLWCLKGYCSNRCKKKTHVSKYLDQTWSLNLLLNNYYNVITAGSQIISLSRRGLVTFQNGCHNCKRDYCLVKGLYWCIGSGIWYLLYVLYYIFSNIS
jgi:hypothetical protein